MTEPAVPLMLTATQMLNLVPATVRQLPMLLPHELLPWLVQQSVFPIDDQEYKHIAYYWQHLRKMGIDTHGARDEHIPLYLWGDDAQVTETSAEKLCVVAFGRVLESTKDALLTVWPLFLYRQAWCSK